MSRIFLVCLALVFATAAQAHIKVVDGDSIRYQGELWRLVGYDTPEIRGARCAAERAHGLKAKARLQELVDSNPVRLVRIKARDRYGRVLGHMWIAAEPVSIILIREALAVPYTKRISRLKNHNWCASLGGV